MDTAGTYRDTSLAAWAWITRLQEFARQIVPLDFLGSVTLDFAQGGVTDTKVTIRIRPKHA